MNSKKQQKFYSDYNLRKLRPLTETQALFFREFESEKNIVATGYAGTGKSLISLYCAFETIFSGKTNFYKIVIIRSAVPSRDIGFLKGGLEEKLMNYELPYIDICNYLFGDEVYNSLKEDMILEFLSTSFLRGLTFVNSIIIVDEAQNCSSQELDTIITRVGKNCKILFLVDEEQTDLSEKEKLRRKEFWDIISRIDEFTFIHFNESDIVRSGLVKKYIIEKNKYYSKI